MTDRELTRIELKLHVEVSDPIAGSVALMAESSGDDGEPGVVMPVGDDALILAVSRLLMDASLAPGAEAKYGLRVSAVGGRVVPPDEDWFNQG